MCKVSEKCHFVGCIPAREKNGKCRTVFFSPMIFRAAPKLTEHLEEALMTMTLKDL